MCARGWQGRWGCLGKGRFPFPWSSHGIRSPLGAGNNEKQVKCQGTENAPYEECWGTAESREASFKPRSENPVAGWGDSAFGNDLLAQDLLEQGFPNPVFTCTWCDSKKWLNSEQISFLDKFSSMDLCRSKVLFSSSLFSPPGILNINLPLTIRILSWIFYLFVCFSVTQK